jgi:hypothetical protein
VGHWWVVAVAPLRRQAMEKGGNSLQIRFLSTFETLSSFLAPLEWKSA